MFDSISPASAQNTNAFEQKLFQEFSAILEEEGLTFPDLSMATRLKDLDLSSMNFLRIVGALEDLVGLPLDAGLAKVETVGDLISELARLKVEM